MRISRMPPQPSHNKPSHLLDSSLAHMLILQFFNSAVLQGNPLQDGDDGSPGRRFLHGTEHVVADLAQGTGLDLGQAGQG